DDGTTGRITVRFHVAQRFIRDVLLQVTASNDRFQDNNVAQVRIAIDPGADATIAGENGPVTVPGFTRQPTPFTLVASARGPHDSTDVVATVNVGGMSLDSASAGGTACAINFNSATCNLGTLAAGATRPISIVAHSMRAGHYSVMGHVTSSNDGDTGNDFG